jgi:hypothetical protein
MHAMLKSGYKNRSGDIVAKKRTHIRLLQLYRLSNCHKNESGRGSHIIEKFLSIINNCRLTDLFNIH